MALSIDQLVQGYIYLRDEKAELKKKQAEEMAPTIARMDKIEAMLLARLNEQQAESIRADHGTAYKTKRSTVKILDWASTFDYIREHELWHMLTRSLAKTAVEEFLEAQGELPPGVDISIETRVNVKR